MYDGEVKSVSMHNAGAFDEVSESMVDGVTEASLLSYARAEMEIIYPDSEDDFELESYRLGHDANGYYISICGSVGEAVANGNFENVRYDLGE